MANARIIQLAPTSKISAVSFEDAFGDYSNAQGRGRERRKNRKLDRIENRAEVKAARQASRQEKVAGRQSVRGQRTAGREELQLARKGKRLSKRETGLESRLARRDARTSSRVGRRDLRNPQEAAEQMPIGAVDTLQPGDAGSMGYTPQDQGGYAPQDQGGYAPQDQGGYAPEDQGYGNEYAYQGEDLPPYASEEGYGDEGDSVYDQSLVDETAENAYDLGYQDALDDSGVDVEITGNEDYGDFDGVMGAEDRYNELQDKNDMPVTPQVQTMADKCIWNEMLIKKLKNDRKNANGNPQEISKAINTRIKRLKDLQNELDFYSNVDGDPEVVVTRKRMVQSALNRARRKAAGQAPITVTPVQRDLNARFSNERIVVPSSEAMSNFTETGITALDDSADYDAPDTREFYINASGFTQGIDLGSIAVGILITVGFIALNKKYKWVKI